MSTPDNKIKCQFTINVSFFEDSVQVHVLLDPSAQTTSLNGVHLTDVSKRLYEKCVSELQAITLEMDQAATPEEKKDVQ